MKWSDAVVQAIGGVADIVSAILGIVWAALHDGHLVRRSSLLAAWWVTFEAYHWCFEAAKASGYDAITIGACAGVLTPVSGLLALVIKFYNSGREAQS